MMSRTIKQDRIAILIGLKQLIQRSEYQAAADMIAALDETIFSAASAVGLARFHALRATVQFHCGSRREALATAADGLEMVKHSGENKLIADLQSLMARCFTEMGELDRAERMYRDLVATYRRLDDTKGVIRTLNRSARIFFIRGRFDRAIETLMDAGDYAEKSDNQKAIAKNLGNLGTIFNLKGAFHRAIEYLEQSATLNQIIGDTENLCRAYLSLAYAQMHLKRMDMARDCLDKAAELIEKGGFEDQRADLAQYQAQFYLLKKNWEKAASCANKALELASADSDANSTRCQVERLLAEAQLHMNQFSAALKSARSALKVAEQIDEHVESGASARVEAMILSRTGDPDGAEKSYQLAARRLDECGADFQLALTHLEWAGVALDSATRHSHRTAAEQILARLDCADLYLMPKANKASSQKPEPVLVGKSPLFLKVVRQAVACANGNIPMLLQGKTGSGKDHLAKYIHANSDRADKPFVVVNCATIPHELAESELFGHEPGAFTNASSRKIGLIEAADGGVLFLNEIGELPMSIQAKLLAVLDTQTFFRLGGTAERHVDVRLIAATNVDLAEAVEAGRFRMDLYYRIAGISLELPRLAMRGDDVFLFLEHFLKEQHLALKGVDKKLVKALRLRMRTYGWHGNVREVKNYVQLYAVTEGRDVEALCRRLLSRLDSEETSPAVGTGVVNLNQEVEKFERSRIRTALSASGGVIRRAAEMLGLPEATLRSKMKKLQISAA